MINLAFPLPALPDGLRFDGVMAHGERQLLQFTELDASSPSYGATFYLDAPLTISERLIAKRAEKRAQFSTPTEKQ